jgi:hypothetical protein
MLIAAVVASGACFAMAQSAAADSRVGVHIGAGGAAIEISHYDRYYDRHARHWKSFRRCWNRVYHSYRFGHRVRVFERLCRDRWGRVFVVYRDVDRLYRW